MSNKIDDGGPAFPKTQFRDVLCCNKHGERITKGMLVDVGGMSLRDWFAGQALMGLMACNCLTSDEADIARLAYKQADAMLEARGSNETL